MEILTTTEGLLFLLRWFHFLAGITWIGLLYYFNFVQTPFFAETEANVRTAAISKLVPRALWWFRWSAFVTVIVGWAILLTRAGQMGPGFLAGSYGWAILVGGILGTVMLANVWGVIWRNQKVVIASAQGVLAGGQPLPEAAAKGRRSALASRTNVVFSIPMLFCMGAASHLSSLIGSAPGTGRLVLPIGGAIVIFLVELNALKGAQGLTKKPLDSVRGAIISGFVLTFVFYLLFQCPA